MIEFLKVSAILLAFFATFAKEQLDQFDLYWGLYTGLIILALCLEYFTYKKGLSDRKEVVDTQEAIEKFREGRIFFEEGIRSGSNEQLEQAIILLTRVVSFSTNLPGQLFRRLSAYSAIALAREKLAYSGSNHGLLFSTNGDIVTSSSLIEKDSISINPGEATNSIRCTSVFSMDSWEKAREAYSTLYSLVENEDAFKTLQVENAQELINSLRNMGYFYLCDYLCHSQEKLKHAKTAFALALEIADRYHVTHRQKDLSIKIEFVNVLEKGASIVEKNVEQKKEVEALIQRVASCKTIEEKVARISASFLGRPYLVNPLIGSLNEKEQLVTRIDGFDCVTYCETVYAIARSENYAAFKKNLCLIRYLDGGINWSSRNHYISDWVDRNVQSGFLTNAPFEHASNKVLDKNLSVLAGIPCKEKEIHGFDGEKEESFRQILKTGDFVYFGSTNPALDGFHCGLIVNDGNVLILRHCAKSKGGVIEEPLSEFLKRESVSALIFSRPLAIE